MDRRVDSRWENVPGPRKEPKHQSSLHVGGPETETSWRGRTRAVGNQTDRQPCAAIGKILSPLSQGPLRVNG